jgi:hypothetical protein
MIWILLFWICFIVIVYTYVGYPLILYAALAFRKFFPKTKKEKDTAFEP